MATDISYPPATMSLPINLTNKYYTIDDFYEVKNNIRDKLGDIMYFSQETRELFEKMSLSVPQIVRKKKYQTEEDWRKKKTSQFKKETNDLNEKNYNELKGYLNKISANNYQSILEEINKILATFQNKEHYLFNILNDILKKARAEPTYCVYYVKIIIGLNDKDNVKKFINELKESFKQTIVNLFVEDNDEVNVEENIENIDDEEETYDEFCLSRKNKNFLKGLSQFIAELFNYQQLNTDELTVYLETLVNNIVTSVNQLKKNGEYMFDNIKKLLHNNIEENVLYLSPLIEKTYETLLKNQLQSHQTEKIQSIFKNIEEISMDKTVVNKNRYLLIDLLDLYKNSNKTKPIIKDTFKIVKPNKINTPNQNNGHGNGHNKLNHVNHVNNAGGYRNNNSRYHKDKLKDKKPKDVVA